MSLSFYTCCRKNKNQGKQQLLSGTSDMTSQRYATGFYVQSVPCHAGFEIQYSVCDTCLENDATQCGGIQILKCITVCRVPTSSGNHGKSQKKVPCMEKNMEFEKT